MEEQRECLICGKPFNPRNSRSILCGDEQCAKARQKMRADKWLDNHPSMKTHWIDMNRPVTVAMSEAIEYASKKGYKVMIALLDCNKGTMTKEDRLHTFTDIESKKLREVIYKEIESEF